MPGIPGYIIKKGSYHIENIGFDKKYIIFVKMYRWVVIERILRMQ